jgi:hypothetical protein
VSRPLVIGRLVIWTFDNWTFCKTFSTWTFCGCTFKGRVGTSENGWGCGRWVWWCPFDRTIFSHACPLSLHQVVSRFLSLPMSRRSSLLTGEGWAWSQIICHQESMGFYNMFLLKFALTKPICKYEKLRKNCTHHHVVNISVYCSTIIFNVLTIILILTICLHQYIGAASTVAPIYLCNCASSTYRWRNAKIPRMLRLETHVFRMTANFRDKWTSITRNGS